MVLAGAGHEIVGIADDQDSAIWQAAEGRPDLVLMDIKLAKNSDGIETARRLQAERPVPVVFVSSHLDSRMRERAASVHPAGYLVKPYSPQRLLEIVSALSAKESAHALR
jgi:DNA-binding NarL/FixJ family response regulator